MTLDPEDRVNQNNVEPSNENTDQGLVLTISYSADGFDFKSISGYRSWEYTSFGDFDFAAVDIGELIEDYDVESFSQEFNISGTVGERVEYVAGLFYADEEFEQHRAILGGFRPGGALGDFSGLSRPGCRLSYWRVCSIPRAGQKRVCPREMCYTIWIRRR